MVADLRVLPSPDPSLGSQWVTIVHSVDALLSGASSTVAELSAALSDVSQLIRALRERTISGARTFERHDASAMGRATFTDASMKSRAGFAVSRSRRLVAASPRSWRRAGARLDELLASLGSSNEHPPVPAETPRTGTRRMERRPGPPGVPRQRALGSGLPARTAAPCRDAPGRTSVPTCTCRTRRSTDDRATRRHRPGTDGETHVNGQRASTGDGGTYANG